MDLTRSASPLEINSTKVIETIHAYLGETVAEMNAAGVCLGLSGGIDSAVLATLAVRALGKTAVHPMYLFDRDSTIELEILANAISDWLGVKLEVRSINAVLHRGGVYARSGFRNRFLAPLLNRILHRIYQVLFRESPFVSSLHLGNLDVSSHAAQQVGFRGFVESFAQGMYDRHIYRREILEKKASEERLLLLGAANRTEWFTGWFVKDGIDDVLIQPLKGLYKTQVRQLAHFLDIPRQVIEQAPSPDMIPGITDEFGLGMSYWKIDLALDHLDEGIPMSEVLHLGVTQAELKQVQKLKQLSQWKRDPNLPSPPVDGNLRGGFRIAGSRGENIT
jgi:NAD+ synthase